MQLMLSDLDIFCINGGLGYGVMTKCIEDIHIFGKNSLLMKYRFFGSIHIHSKKYIYFIA